MTDSGFGPSPGQPGAQRSLLQKEIEAIGSADVVIGLIPPSLEAQTIDDAIQRIFEATLPVRAVLLHPAYAGTGAGNARQHAQWHILADTRLAQDSSQLSQSFGNSFRAIFDTSQQLNARCCAIIASDLSTVKGTWIELLVNPVINGEFDLIAPNYARDPFDGMINRSVVYPLVRALYRKRVRNPLGPDFGISSRLLNRMGSGTRPRLHPLASLMAEATASGLKICQSNLGPRLYSPPDWVNPGPLLAQLLGALFLDVDRFAAVWQRGQGSQPVPEFGQPRTAAVFGVAPDPQALITAFQLGTKNLLETWGTVLAPSVLVELRKLARQESAAFRLPDEIWARIVYDFALAYRLRSQNREQMLRSITPIYQAWAASYVLEIASASPSAVEQRVEQLCVAFESMKSYFVSRWRWPDRFNP